MSHPHDEIEQLKLRIQELEKGVQQRKWTRVLLLFALGAVLLCAADKVSERLVVEDRDGRVRASLHVNPQNGRASGMSLFDMDGRMRVDLGVSEDGHTIFRLFDMNGNVRDLAN